MKKIFTKILIFLVLFGVSAKECPKEFDDSSIVINFAIKDIVSLNRLDLVNENIIRTCAINTASNCFRIAKLNEDFYVHCELEKGLFSVALKNKKFTALIPKFSKETLLNLNKDIKDILLREIGSCEKELARAMTHLNFYKRLTKSCKEAKGEVFTRKIDAIQKCIVDETERLKSLLEFAEAACERNFIELSINPQNPEK